LKVAGILLKDNLPDSSPEVLPSFPRSETLVFRGEKVFPMYRLFAEELFLDVSRRRIFSGVGRRVLWLFERLVPNPQ